MVSGLLAHIVTFLTGDPGILFPPPECVDDRGSVIALAGIENAARNWGDMNRLVSSAKVGRSAG